MMKVAGAAMAWLVIIGPAQAADFAGPTLGVAVNYTRAGLDAARINAGVVSAGVMRASLHAGYDFRVVERVVAGFEVSADLGNQEVCAVGTRGRYCARVGSEVSALARGGYVVTPKLLLFGEAGYARAPARMTYTDALVPRRNSTKSGDLSGLRLGTGAEVALSDRAFARLNYRYTDYWCGIKERQVLAGVGLRF